MEKLDLKTAIQIAKIVIAVPENRMPIIWDIFNQAGLDIGGLDEMAEWKALTRQAFLIDTEQFLTDITRGRVPVNGEYQIPVGEFNEFCNKQKLGARCTRKHLAGLRAIRTAVNNSHTEYTCSVWKQGENCSCRCVCIYLDWRQRIKEAKEQQ